jgi:copper chaperone
MDETRFIVDGISCGHDKDKIKKGISQLTGVRNVDVSLSDKTVTIHHDASLISEQKLRETIEHEGYNVIS